MQAKRCGKCSLTRPLGEFYKSNQPRHSHGVMPHCKACVKIASRKRYEKNRESILSREARRRRELRAEVISAYGGRCACCGITGTEFLSIDHLEGNGRAHHKEAGSTKAVYEDVKRAGFPAAYQVLCMNCNCARFVFGVCPHQSPPALDSCEPPKPAARRCQRKRKAVPLPRGHKTLGVLRHCARCDLWKQHRGFHGTAPYCIPCTKVIRRASRPQINRANRRLGRAIRMDTIKAYGGACACCGESSWWFLTIDHKMGDGAEDRRAKKASSGLKFYRLLKKLGHPTDRFQLLCYNCNFAKGQNEECPHDGVKKCL